MTTKYRIYCTDPSDEGFRFVWGSNPPTECPNNAAHTVNPNSVKAIAEERPVYIDIPASTASRSKSYERIATIPYNKNRDGELRRVKVLARMDSGATSYDIEIFEHGSSSSLVEGNFNNTTLEIMDIGVPSTLPSGDILLDVNVKRTSSKNRKYARIEKVILYTEQKI